MGWLPPYRTGIWRFWVCLSELDTLYCWNTPPRHAQWGNCCPRWRRRCRLGRGSWTPQCRQESTLMCSFLLQNSLSAWMVSCMIEKQIFHLFSFHFYVRGKIWPRVDKYDSTKKTRLDASPWGGPRERGTEIVKKNKRLKKISVLTNDFR